MLCRDLPEAIDNFIEKFDCNKFNEAIALEKKQQEIRKWLKGSEYCAFIANESILPRFKGTELPMQNAVPFKSTLNDEIEVCGAAAVGHFKGAYQTRNREMVDRADLIVFCIQHESGGAWQTMKYARKQNIPYINLNELVEEVL